MTLPARGARPLGRAGSFVAGADDLEAIYYNPAGLAGTGGVSAMIGGGLVFQGVRYERVDSGGVPLAPVENQNHLIPIPFLGVSWRPEGLSRRVTFALGAFAPYMGVPEYPENGPQRYSLVSIAGTAIAVAELAVAIRLTPLTSPSGFYLGAGFQNMFFSLNNRTTLSGCTELNCPPEDPNFDSPTQVKVSSPFTPSGNVGLLYVHPMFRLGASVQLPFWVRASGTVKSRLPKDPQFDGAEVVGDKIDVDLNLPAVARVGAEVRPVRGLRIEVGVDYEAWQMQDKIRFVPREVYIDNIHGIGRYDLRPMEIDRSMQGVWGVHIGGEYDALRWLTVRAGYLYETSGVPKETLSVLTPDGAKHLLALGLSARVWKLRVDVGYGHFFQPDRTVQWCATPDQPGCSRSYQLNPIQPSPFKIPVGSGTYQVRTDVLSVALEGRF